MLKTGNTNAQIQEVVSRKFGSSIGPDALAKIRAALKTSGANRGSKKKKTAPDKSLVLLPDDGISARFKEALQATLDQMPAEEIQAFAMTADGTVRVQQIHEFMLTPPPSQVLGLLGSRL
jgi:hypothetical protein